MLLIILEQAPAETTLYMIAGYGVIFSIRRRNLKRQMELLEEMQSKQK
jgi:hypothetical protein